MRIVDEARLRRAVRDGDEAEVADVINGLSRFGRLYDDIERVVNDVDARRVGNGKIRFDTVTIRDHFGWAEVEG